MTAFGRLIGLAMAGAPAMALAGEGVMNFTRSTMFWTWITFGVVLAVLWRFAWGPILGSLQKREEGIRRAIADAETARRDAERVREELEDRLEKARAEAEAIIREGREDALRVKERYERDQRAEGEAFKQRALNEIELAKGKALEEIRQEARALAIQIARKVLEREVKAADHEALVEEALAGYDRAVKEMERS